MRTLKHNTATTEADSTRRKFRSTVLAAAIFATLASGVVVGSDVTELQPPATRPATTTDDGMPPTLSEIARTPEAWRDAELFKLPTEPAKPAEEVETPATSVEAPAAAPALPAPQIEPALVQPAVLPIAGDISSAPVVTADLLGPATRPVLAPATQPTVAVEPVIAPAPATRPAAIPLIENIPADGRINLLVGRHVVIKTRTPYTRVSLTQPDVASDNLVDPTSILLTAKKAGSAQLIVWDDKDQSQVVDLLVDVDLNALTEMIKKAFPTSDVTLSNANGTLVARGRVPSLQTAEQIVELLSAYGKVINFLEMSGGQQVMMQVRFAEVSRSASTALGVNFGFNDGQSGFGNNVPGGGPYGINGTTVGNLSRSIGAGVTLFGGGRVGNADFDILVTALRNNNLLRVLAEPNLSTMSGKEAKFLAGGEFPIPVPQAGGGGNAAITVEYKQFGIQLTFVPVVLGDGRIRINGTAEVSDLDYSRSVTLSGFVIPSLTKRTVTNTIELQEGQTFAVAGLLNNRVTANKQAVPLLGDIPVLGALFRSVRYERNETELVVLVTPRLVEGMNPKQVPDLPGSRWIYPTENDLFLNSYLGGPGAKDATTAKPGPVRYRGLYGFVPADAAPNRRPTGPDVATTGDALDH
jgi:pilus assembly protein CpaC